MSKHTPLVSPHDNKTIPHTTDAVIWAKEFLRATDNLPGGADEPLMITWFSNSIMAGVDEQTQRDKAKIDKLRAALMALVGAESEKDLRNMAEVIKAMPDSVNRRVALLGINTLLEVL